jgi:hypothetical protein
MANNYCQTSFVLDCKEEEAREDVYTFAMALINEDGDEGDYIHPDVTNSTFDRDEFCGGSIDRDDDDTMLWFCGEECFDHNWFDVVISYAMKKYKLSPMGFTWADTCSKMRTDEFSGGASFYYYDAETDEVKSESVSGYSWLQDKIRDKTVAV